MSQISFMAALSQLEVEGVVRRYVHGESLPGGLSSVDMPCQWVQVPGLTETSVAVTPFSSSQSRGEKTRRAALVVVVSPVGQREGWKNQYDTSEMVDNVEAALDASQLGSAGLPAYEIVATPAFAYDDTEKRYWAVVALVQIRELGG